MTRKFDETGGVLNSLVRKIRWLASYPKSGNTWVRMFLNAYATKFPLDLNSAYQFITSDLRPETYQMMMPRSLQELTLQEQFFYHPGALLNLIKLSPTKDAYVKTHNAKATIESFTLIPPSISGPSIYILRDPRDIVISMSEHFKNDLDICIQQLRDVNRFGKVEFANLHHLFMDWSTHVISWTTKNKDVPVFIVRYEDLLAQPKKAFMGILEQFGIEFDEERFHFALKESSFDSLQAKEDKEGFVEKQGGEKFFRVGKAGQWKTVLSKTQIETIENDHGKVMAQYGYL